MNVKEALEKKFKLEDLTHDYPDNLSESVITWDSLENEKFRVYYKFYESQMWTYFYVIQLSNKVLVMAGNGNAESTGFSSTILGDEYSSDRDYIAKLCFDVMEKFCVRVI